MQVFRSIKWDTPNNTRSDKHLTNITVSDRLCFGDHKITLAEIEDEQARNLEDGQKTYNALIPLAVPGSQKGKEKKARMDDAFFA